MTNRNLVYFISHEFCLLSCYCHDVCLLHCVQTDRGASGRLLNKYIGIKPCWSITIFACGSSTGNIVLNVVDDEEKEVQVQCEFWTGGTFINTICQWCVVFQSKVTWRWKVWPTISQVSIHCILNNCYLNFKCLLTSIDFCQITTDKYYKNNHHQIGGPVLFVNCNWYRI